MLSRFLRPARFSLRAMSTASPTPWSRLIRFIPEGGTTALIGAPRDAAQDVGLAAYEGAVIEVDVYAGSSMLDAGAPTGQRATVARLLSPLGEHEVGSIRCIGLNYAKHAQETHMPLPSVPILFLKPSTALCDPYPAPIVIPRFTQASQSADYESELAVVIGRDCKDVGEHEALSYVLGYTAGNDVSSRVAQLEQSQWSFSKGFDKASPIGAALISSASCPDPSILYIVGTKNGVVKQQSSISDLVFNVPKLVSFLSQGTTLRAGTVILTGTPFGVGYFSKEREFLRHGDEFRIHITGGIGTLINKIEYE